MKIACKPVMNVAQKIQSVPWVNQSRPQPIERWLRALSSSGDEAADLIRAAYRENLPTQCELIFTGACDFACQHCIYPPTFARFNSGMTKDQWGHVLEDIVENLGIRTFVYGGRSLSAEGLDVLSNLRRQCPDVQIGLIDNGISLASLRERLVEIAPDWIDISLDGQEREHDLQRRRVGSFRAGLEGALWVARNGIAPKVNVLTCLTTINRHSVIEMIRRLNGEGFKNFFVTPIIIVDGVRPDLGLRVEPASFACFLKELQEALSGFNDCWIEVNMYGVEYFEALCSHAPEIVSAMVSQRDSLSWHLSEACSVGEITNDLFVNYYPFSLTGVRELIVNTNGDVVLPKAMSYGKIPEDLIVGNLLCEAARKVVGKIAAPTILGDYLQELNFERQHLQHLQHLFSELN